MRTYARLGGERDTILTALGVDPNLLQDPSFVLQLQQELARGEALFQLDLLAERRRLARGGDGKVSAVLAGLREKLSWDRPDAAKSRKGQRPDSEAAVAELERVIQRTRG